MITRTVDAQDSIILVASVGAATREEIDTHYDALRDMIADMRRAGRPVRVLSDQSRATRLSEELNQHIKSQIERTYQTGDRLALLMPSTADKMYVRGVLGVADHAVFDSRIAAEMWLMQPSQRPPSA